MKLNQRALLTFIFTICLIFMNGRIDVDASDPYTLTNDDVVVTDGVITSYTYSGSETDIIIPSILDGQTVTGIGTHTFKNIGLTSVVIPDTVTSIGCGSFKNNSLTSVVIPDAVTNIGENAFEKNSLTSINIPDNVLSIGVSAFSYNDLTSVTLPDGITEIKTFVFFDNSLTSVKIPNGVTSIGVSAFYNNSLTSVEIPDSVTSIGEKAFYKNALTNVEIPNSVTSIGESAFEENQLENVIISDNVSIICKKVFYKNLLTDVKIPDGVTSIGDFAFAENRLKNTTIPINVTSIGEYAFHKNALTSIIIPKNITELKQGVFANNQLENVILPENITSIGGAAFYDNLLTSITILGNVTNIGGYAFYNNALTSVEIPNNVTEISDGMFGNNELTSMTIPDNVTNIGNYAFYNNSLTNIEIPNNVTNIGDYAFYKNGLTSVEIPNKVTSIGEYAFYNNAITGIEIPDSVTSIGNYAFCGNELTSLEIPYSMKSIGWYAFSCNKLESVIIANSKTVINYMVLSGQHLPNSTFMGWYENSDFSGEQFDFNAARRDNKIIYGYYQKNTYHVYFEENGGSEVSDITGVEYDTTIAKPETPFMIGYTFSGWYKDSTLENKWNYTTDTIKSNTTLYAKWIKNQYDVTFNSSGGSEVSGLTNIEYDTTIPEPIAPVKEGYNFDGWYKEDTLTSPWNFTTDTVIDNTTLYAKWTNVSSGGSSSSSSSSKNKNVVKAITDRGSFQVGKKNTTYNKGQKVISIKVNEQSLKNQADKLDKKSTISIPIKGKTNVARTELDVQDIKYMQKKELILEIKTNNITYKLPTSQIDIDDISQEIGKDIELDDIKFTLDISKTNDEMVKIVKNSSKEKNLSVVVPPVDFQIEASYKSKKYKLDKFNSYVPRMIEIPKGTDISKITTAIITEKDGSFRHVPTYVTIIDGKYYATINSLTNSTYTLIYNEATFDDVTESHWAKADIEKMASRLVVEGKTNDLFEPNEAITRGELAIILVKALGLKPVEIDKFSDVENNTYISSYIGAAYNYGIIKGTSDTTFNPEGLVTRQEAMTMIFRASKVANFTNKEDKININSYEDYIKVADYAKEAVAWNVNYGIVKGKSDTTLAPYDNITRAELSAVTNRFLMSAGLID